MKVGDKVKRIKTDTSSIKVGDIVTISKIEHNWISVSELPDKHLEWKIENFELVEDGSVNDFKLDLI